MKKMYAISLLLAHLLCAEKAPNTMPSPVPAHAHLIAHKSDDMLKLSPFGKLLEQRSVFTGFFFKFQAGESPIFRATQDVNDNIKAGDLFYLDLYHKDHIEVFDARGNAKIVLCLDGQVHQWKTDAALRSQRTLNIIIPKPPYVPRHAVIAH